MNLSEQGYTWAYCYLCEGLELICPKCKKSSCCGGACDFCSELFKLMQVNHSKFIKDHAIEIPDTIPVIGKGMEKLIEATKGNNG